MKKFILGCVTVSLLGSTALAQQTKLYWGYMHLHTANSPAA